ncbi:intradiol ring-cleavage dioxygenase [Gilvimarinus chinensis]|uniref:intradiol ring-cleavage dioxygenase n=1 Tax=Gilvimarinus chinensis TaxID=396005 RepID=UPI000380AD64|nr:intradiol ring-cleavage dioxygenase [Gilvimarinus chinensis]
MLVKLKNDLNLTQPRPRHLSQRLDDKLAGTRLAGCGSASNNTGAANASSSPSISTEQGSCVLMPQETEGPYPLSVILSNSAYVRGTIHEDKPGIPLALKFNLVDINNGCEAFPYASIYVWHCDKDGLYSGYSQPGANTIGETFCRGIQDVNQNGEVTFHTIFPGWYAGRLTHIHFQVFLYNDTASVATATSQLAFPDDIVEAVYNSDLYGEKGQNTPVRSCAEDGIFADGIESQLVSIKGSVSDGYTATLTIGVAVN